MKSNQLIIALLLWSAAQVAWPQPPAVTSAPALTRAQVKKELEVARKAGEVPINEEGMAPRDLNPRAYAAKSEGKPLTRADVKADLKSARNAGDLPTGDTDETPRSIDPSRYPKQPGSPGLTREQVKAETKAAIRAGDIQVGETGQSLAQQNPSRYSGSPAKPPKLHLPHRKSQVASSPDGSH